MSDISNRLLIEAAVGVAGIVLVVNFAEYQKTIEWGVNYPKTSLLIYSKIRKEDADKSAKGKFYYNLGLPGRKYGIYVLKNEGHI